MKENDKKTEVREVLIKQKEKEKEKKPTKIDKINEYFDKNKNFFFGLTFFGRLIMTLYSFHGLFFIYNIIIEYILLIPGLLFEIDSTKGKIAFSIVYIFFSLSCSNLLIIPTYEFLTFPYLHYKNPLSHLLSFIYIFKEKEFNFDNIVKDYPTLTALMYLFFIIIEFMYFIGFILSLFTNIIIFKDIIKLIILIFIYSYYLIICFCYFVLSLYLFKKILFPIFIKTIALSCISCICCLFTSQAENNSSFIEVLCLLFTKNFNLMYIEQINNNFKEKPKLPDINLINYMIEPFLLKNYKDENNRKVETITETYYEDFSFNFIIIFKILLSISALIIFFFSSVIKFNYLSILLFIILFSVMSLISISFNFPSCCRNRKTFGNCLYNPKIKLDEKEYSPRYPTLMSLIRIICNLVLLFVSIILVIIFIFLSDDDNKDDFKDISFIENGNKTDDLLLPNICYSSLYNLPLYLYLPFINDAYYYRDKKNETGFYYYSSLENYNYNKLFFDNDYKIYDIRNLVNKTDSGTVKMIQYNIINKRKNIEITILSIKGTTFNKDIYLDAQLYFSSVLLNLLSTFSIITQKDTMSFRLIEYSLSIPYRLFFRFLIIDDYLKKLQKAYIENEYKFFKNVVVVGHSLGGGLAKLFGRIIKKQAISLSGPGINAFNSLWNYEGKSENFEISAIDLVPDRDLVPRVEISGGTIYRIICKFGILDCHSKVNSLCEVLIMCKIPSYKEYCMKVAELNKKQINTIYESIDLN